MTASHSLAGSETRRTTHELKVWRMYFDALASGEKTFEYRKDDRTPRFEVGDTLHLREWGGRDMEYSGRECWRKVIYVARGGPIIPEGYCIMSLAAAPSVESDPAPAPVAGIDVEATQKLLRELVEFEEELARRERVFKSAERAAIYDSYAKRLTTLADALPSFVAGQADTALVNELERMGVQSIYFRDESQLNLGLGTLRSAFPYAIRALDAASPTQTEAP